MAVTVPKRLTQRLRSLAKQQAALRDKLRALESEIGEFVEANDDAAESLQRAVDRLSELV